jgi:Kef-type K+ transport system membrane component KefB
MMEYTFYPLLVVSILAFVIPLVVSRIRKFHVPGMILAILCGVAVGPQGLGLVDPSSEGGGYLEFLSEFGFVFLMFVSGLEVDVNSILYPPGRRRERGILANPLAGGLLHFVLTLAISAGLALAMEATRLIDNWMPTALILATTAVGIVMPTLKQRHETDTGYGQSVIVAAVVADLLALMLLTVMILVHRGGDPLETMLFGLLVAGFLVAWLAGRVFTRRRGWLYQVLDELSHTSGQVKVRGALALMVAFVALAQAVGAELIIGAFMAGVILSMFTHGGSAALRQKIEAIGFGFFIPVFFIMVGVGFDVEALLNRRMLVFVPVVIVAALIVKMTPSVLLWRRAYGTRDAVASGFLLTARLSLIIAAADITLRTGMISEGLHSAFILLAALTSTVSPVVYGSLKRRVGAGRPRIFVLGAGRLGRGLAHRLSVGGMDVTLIDRDPDQFEKLELDAVKRVTGDALREGTLERLDIEPRDTFVALTGTDDTNRRACERVRERFGVDRLIARDSNPDNTQAFRVAGIVPMDPVGTGASALESMIVRPHVYDLMLAGADRADRVSFEVEHRNPELDGVEISALPYRGDFLLISVRRDEELLVPHGHTRLRTGDFLLCIGSEEDAEHLRSLFEKR